MVSRVETRCPLCGSIQQRLISIVHDRMFGVTGSFRLVRCVSCSLVFIFPQPSSKTLSRHYPEAKYYAYSVGKNGFFGRLRSSLIRATRYPTMLSRLFSILVNPVPAIPAYKINGKILDIGCGTGDTLALLSEIGWDTYGIEPSREAVAIARRRGLKHIRKGTHLALASYPADIFDVIRMHHVFEHIKSPNECLRHVFRILKHGGTLFIGVPNVDSLASRIFGTFWYNLDAPRHLFHYSPTTIRILLEKHGFILDRVNFSSAGGLLGSIQYILSDALGWTINLIHKPFLVLLFYPIEWIIDRLCLGDIIIVTVKKTS